MDPETEKQKFFRRLAEKRANGLTGFHVSVNPDATPCDEEDLYAELNRMEDVPTVPMRDGVI